MRTQQNMLYTYASSDHFEPIDRVSPRRSDFIDRVLAQLEPSWTAGRFNLWFQCSAPGHEIPRQGWKIHISATMHNAAAVLDAIVPVLRAANVTFKFAADARFLALVNSKRWPRGASGKFVTVYPAGEAEFVSLIEELHRATAGEAGPYVLSDRRYKDSTCVHYRYGSMRLPKSRDISGASRSTIVGPDGSEIDDERAPFFRVPPWATDPFAAPRTVDGEAGTLKDGRYRIDGVISFSNSGGVYIAHDRETERKVVIKEARPKVSWTSSRDDAKQLLRKEYRILEKLAPTGVAATPLDYFSDWEHEFLVEDYLSGVTLAQLPPRRAVLLRTRPERTDFELYYAELRNIFLRLSEIVGIVHAHGIVFADLSPNNVMLDEATGELRMIDFETACELGVDTPTGMWTHGFAPDDAASVQNDAFALGSMLFNFVFNYSSTMQMSPQAKARIVRSLCADARIPSAVERVAAAMLERDPAVRPSAAALRSALDASPSIADAPSRDREAEPDLVRELLDGTMRYIEAHADAGRSDRLFPACFRLFESNPLSVSYGACGTALAMQRVRGVVPDELVEWILARRLTPDAYPPGLALGMAGIAWSLLELGRQDDACAVLDECERHPLLHEQCDFAFGLAGYGLACLKFFHVLGDEAYLQRARAAADEIVRRGIREEGRGVHWPQHDGTHLGLYYGSSGIALFLLYVSLATGEERYKAAGRVGLDYDLSFSQPTPDGGVTWGYRPGGPAILVPYFAYGTAGVGSALLRYLRYGANDDLASWLDPIAIDTDRKYTVLPGKQNGLSGIGGFHLDAYALTGERRFLDMAYRAFSGIRLHAVERDTGIAFGGDFQSKLSCDYASGSGGVAMFLHRLSGGGPPEFFLDEYQSSPIEAVPA
jgi:tRNA A-37 threonylcarbamoyl transferase component Bud32